MFLFEPLVVSSWSRVSGWSVGSVTRPLGLLSWVKLACKRSAVSVTEQETWARLIVLLEPRPSRGSPAPAHQIYITLPPPVGGGGGPSSGTDAMQGVQLGWEGGGRKEGRRKEGRRKRLTLRSPLISIEGHLMNRWLYGRWLGTCEKLFWVLTSSFFSQNFQEKIYILRILTKKKKSELK